MEFSDIDDVGPATGQRAAVVCYHAATADQIGSYRACLVVPVWSGQPFRRSRVYEVAGTLFADDRHCAGRRYRSLPDYAAW